MCAERIWSMRPLPAAAAKGEASFFRVWAICAFWPLLESRSREGYHVKLNL